MALWAVLTAMFVVGVVASSHGLASVLQDWFGGWGPARR